MDDLRRAAEDYRQARQQLEQAIRDAYANDQSLRAIAKQVGWSHEQIRRLINQT